jgi:hypothetical protein
MINLDQIKLLEAKVAKAVEYVEKVTGENAVLLQKEAELQAKLEADKKRIDELEVLIMRFKEEQGQIEDGILSALDRLNQFEEAMENSLTTKPAGGRGAVKDAVKTHTAKGTAEKTAAKKSPDGGDICFEIPETGTDVSDPIGTIVSEGDILSEEDILSVGEDEIIGALLDEDLLEDTGNPPAGDGELDIF